MKNIVNQTVLYINLSHKWGTDEKSLIRDAQIVSDLGYQVLVLCVRDSFLDLRLKALNLPTVYDQSKNKSWLRRPLSFFFELRGLITHNAISLIHTYDLFSLWPLGQLLKRFPYIPLVYTRSQEMNKGLKSFIHRLFLSRIDLVITPAKGLRENLISSLPIRPKRIHVSGLGLVYHEDLELDKAELKRALLKKYGHALSSICFGTYVEVDMTDVISLIPILVAVQYIIQNHSELDDQKKVLLFFFCERNWHAHPLFAELMKKIKEYDLQDHVVLHTTEELEQDVSMMDVWISYQDSEYIRDQEIFALFHNVHLILPRVGGFYEILLDHRWGHTYKASDSRDLRFHLEAFLKKPETYSLKDNNLGLAFLRSHSWQEHRLFLEQSYLKLMSKRYRLFSARKRLKRFLKNMGR